MRPPSPQSEATLVSRTPKRKSPADLRRDAARVQRRIEQRLQERSEAWATGDGRDPFMVIRQDGDATPGRNGDDYLHREVPGSLKGLHGEKRNAMHGTRLGGKES